MNVPGIPRFASDAVVLLLMVTFTTACASAGSDEPATAAEPDNEVSIGYGTQDASDVTGSVGSLSADDVGDQQVTSLYELLHGRFAGVHVERLPSGGISVRIRGASSIYGQTEPLYVIDGVPIQGSANSALLALDPNNIARIDILKDAGSAAIYGSRGGNGVVLITTKRDE